MPPKTHPHGKPPPVGIAYSEAIFAKAPLPPGARPTATAVPTLRLPGDTLPHQVDVHRLYLVPGTRGFVASYLLHHLPPGASANQGITIQTDPVSYDAEFIPVTMPAAGPNEFRATLLFAFAADGAGTQELRVDAETTSVPTRTAALRVSPAGRVVVTGYEEMSLMGPGTGVSVSLTGAAAAALRAVFNRLGMGIFPECMEFESLYQIRFLDPAHVVTASGDFCAGDNVGFTSGRRSGGDLWDPHCLLLAAVVRALPGKGAKGTDTSLHTCREIYVG